MPFILTLQTDGGLEAFKVGLGQLDENTKSFKKLFQMIINYFEDQEIRYKTVLGENSKNPKTIPRTIEREFIPNYKSPILSIWQTEGGIIGADWTNKPQYQEWKEKYYEKKRLYDVPIGWAGKQVLTGHTLHALLHSDDSWAVRIANDLDLVYGLNNEYSKYWQDKRRILDLFPAMEKDLQRIVAAFIRDSGALDWEGEQ